MNDKPNNGISKFATPSMLIALASAIIWLIVEVKKIPTIDRRLEKKIEVINQMHKDIDALELMLKDAKIERLEAEIEFYKNK